MEQEGRPTSVNRSEKTVVRAGGRRMRAPRFDEGSIQRARPAVPLSRAVSARWPPASILLTLAAVALGIVAGVVGTSLYRGRGDAQTPAARVQTEATAGEAVETQTQYATAAEEPPPAHDAEETASAEVSEASRDVEPVERPAEVTTAAVGSEPTAEETAALSEALGEWLDATNARDIRRQMDFYNPRLEAFYLSRNASASAVRAEKERVFSRAELIDVRANGPASIRLGPDGRTATMRFRKRYQIEGEGVARRGEVVQELRWRKTEHGWRIVSERDLRVLN
jgi:ketosteroid isomerase-like protein